jgi:hypothetical protein
MATQIREENGKEVVVIPRAIFESQYKEKKMRRKERFFIDNDIDLKYLDTLHSSKGRYTLKITNIPNMEELKKLISINEQYEAMKEASQDGLNSS